MDVDLWCGLGKVGLEVQLLPTPRTWPRRKKEKYITAHTQEKAADQLIHTGVHMYIHAQMHTHVQTRIYTYTHRHTHRHTHTRTYRMYVCVHTNPQAKLAGQLMMTQVPSGNEGVRRPTS